MPFLYNLETIARRVRPQTTVLRIRIECWIPKATKTRTHAV
jgi:hypothetical protein